MPNRMIIEIEEDSIMLTEIKNGVASRKATSLPDLQTVLTRDRNLETPLLPGFYGTQKFVSAGDRELYVFTAPPHIRQVSYDYRAEAQDVRVKRFKVALPGTLWIMTVALQRSGGQETRTLRHTMGYALKQPLLGEKDQLYKLPFSNVGGDYICWGGNDPRLGGPKSIQSIPEAFFNNAFNSDLDGNKYSSFTWEKELPSGGKQAIPAFRCSHLLEYLDQTQREAEKEGKNSEFRYNILVPSINVMSAIQNHIARIAR